MDQNSLKTPKLTDDQKSDELNDENKGILYVMLAKRKRRSKNEIEGRSFVCECGKSYLSQPALTNHKKTKHESDKNTEKRGRGRPKKNVINNNDMIQKAELKFKTFFEKENRKKALDVAQLSMNVVEKVFLELVQPYNEKFQNRYYTLDDHPLLRHIKSHLYLTENGINKESSKSCDEIKFEYLKDVVQKTNENYFLFIFKFVILFRECINKFKKTDDHLDKEYCEVRGAETAPDLCNEFIIEFMEVNQYFGINSDENKNEFIEIIQHFCLWLYDNGHTSSRLTLLI